MMSEVLKIIEDKTCKTCGIAKPLSEFNSRGLNRYRTECKSCQAARNKKWREDKCSTPEGRAAYLENKKEEYRATRVGIPDGRKTVIEIHEGRECIECGMMKSWEEFSKDSHGYNGRTPNCKQCRREKFKYHYDNNPKVKRQTLKQRPSVLKKKYGITYEDVIRTFLAQDSKCANATCRQELSLEVGSNHPNRAVIDHCHRTGKFRAIICRECNLGLGMFEKNEIRFSGFKEYIAKYSRLTEKME